MARLKKTELFASLPAPWPHDLLPVIRQAVAASRRKVVVLDDDPTGTQTVYDVPVLTGWSVEDLRRELAGNLPAFYVLTNTRAFLPEEAVRINCEIARNLTAAAGQVPGGRDFVVISRSDSTLRGHYPIEVDALGGALRGGQSIEDGNQTAPPVLLVPYFEAGGRFTVNDIHYVAEGDELVPAAETPFAQDTSFGYRNSDLRAWVEEKTLGRISAGAVAVLSIADIREGGPELVRERLLALRDGDVCVVNAAAPRDLEVVAWAALEAENAGHRLIYRTAASFVAARLGLEPRPLWAPGPARAGCGGLIVAGSHVPKTTEQLQCLLTNSSVEGIELDVNELLSPRRHEIVMVAIRRVNELLDAGRDVAVFTSRVLITAADAAESLGLGARVSSALVEIVRGLQVRPRYFVAKGGITSSDLATQGLGVKRAMVLGQILPGVPVWELGAEAKFPGLPYVVFPGNVGGRESLDEAVLKLSTLKRQLKLT